MDRSSLRLAIATFLALSALIGLGAPVGAQSVIAAIPVGSAPVGVAVNPTTNRVYVANLDSNNVSVVDGASNAVVATIPLVGAPAGVAVNPTTNRIYVTVRDSTGGTVASVIDGTSNSVIANLPISAGGPFGSPRGVAVNPATNRVYVEHFGSGTAGGTDLTVIDGGSNAVVVTIPVSGSVPRGAPAVNPATNLIYVPDGSLTSGNVVVIDGARNTVVTSISLSPNPVAPPAGLGVNPTTNRLYVSVSSSLVIDGTSNAILASIPVANPGAVAVNPATNRIYVATTDNTVSAVDGASNKVVASVPVGSGPSAVAVNPATSRVYVANQGSNSISVIEDAVAPPPFTPVSTWFFAEGSTQQPFDTWFLVQNPGVAPATVRFTFQLQGGGTVTHDFIVGPTSRFSLFANQVIPNVAFSTRIDSNQTVFAERAMYVGYDGTDVTGIPAPNRTWLFAEGATTPPFHTWLLLQNPNALPATATITYFPLGGASPLAQTLSLPALSRTSVFVNQVLPNAAFSSRVDSDLPIVAERAMYRFPGNAATANSGVNTPDVHWSFPDANTTQGAVPFDSFLLLLNPNDTTVGTAIILDQDGRSTLHIRQLPPHSRVNVFLNEVMPNARFGVEVNADLPIIVERSEFFNHEPRGAISTQGWNGTLRSTWLLPEGSTQPPFNETIAIFNPSGALMFAHLDFQLPTGQVIGRDVTVGTLRTVLVNVNAVVPNSPVSTKVTTSVPSVVERLMFFNKLGSIGGTDTIAIPL